ncbi:MAG: hypothetical protein WCI74_16345 [Actinomycetes bacterium]
MTHLHPAAQAAGAVLLASITATALVGCSGTSQQAEDTTAPSASATALSLPDGIPLPDSGQLAAPVRTAATTGAVSGWSAVALTPPQTDSQAVTASLQSSLQAAGWTVSKTGTPDRGLALLAHSPATNPVRWLNISVTTAIPSSGPAVTYRYAQRSVPLPTPSGRAQ